jgi:hypothetical protein
MARKRSKKPFDVQVFLNTVQVGRSVSNYRKNQKIFAQGDKADAVFYIQDGQVKLSVISELGKEAVVALHGKEDFFGEGCLNGQSLRLASAAAMTDCVIMRFDWPATEIFHGDLESGLEEGRTDEASAVHGRSDHRGAEGARGGAKTADLARKHGVSEATLYNWKAKYGGLDVSEAKRLKQLEDENAKLKKLLAEQMLDAAALRELLSKKR